MQLRGAFLSQGVKKGTTSQPSLGASNPIEKRKLAMAALLLLSCTSFLGQTSSAVPQQDAVAHARELLQSGQAREAVQVLQSYLQTHADSAEGSYLLAYALYSAHEPRLSLQQYTEAAKLSSPSATDLMAVSADYILLADYSDAARWLTQVTQMEPTNSLAWYYLGRSYYLEQHYPEAAKAFSQAQQLRPQYVRAAVGQGLVEEAQGDVKEAMATYQKAQSWQAAAPVKDAQPYISAGELALKQGDLPEALKDFVEAKQLSHGNPHVGEDLGRVYERMNRNAEAEHELLEAEKAAPDAGTLHFLRGTALERLGKKDEAAAEFARTKQLLGTKANSSAENFDLQP